MNRTSLPPGVQPAARLPVGAHVSRRGTPPSALTTYTSVNPRPLVEYAICVRSGEKYGPAETLPTEVSLLASPPSRATTQISSAYRKAILSWPSEGLRSSRGEALRAAADRSKPATTHSAAPTNPCRSMSKPRVEKKMNDSIQLMAIAAAAPVSLSFVTLLVFHYSGSRPICLAPGGFPLVVL